MHAAATASQLDELSQEIGMTISWRGSSGTALTVADKSFGIRTGAVHAACWTAVEIPQPESPGRAQIADPEKFATAAYHLTRFRDLQYG